MNLFGLTILRTKAASLSSVSGSRGWFPFIHEMSAGAWQRNEDVNVDTVLSNPTLYACVTLIAGDIAKLRPKLVEQDANRIWTEVDSPSFSPFLRKPNHFQSRIDFYEWWMLSKLCHGNTYVLKARDGRNVVQAGYVLDPFRVKPLVSPDGSVFYQLSGDQLARVEDSVVVPAREIMHDVMCPLFHPLVGVSPIYAAGYPAIQGLNIRGQSNKFFTNGSKPGGVLTAPGAISNETAIRLKDYWDANFSGDNVGKIAVLGDGLKYEAMAVTAEDAQLVEQLHMSDEDIVKCYHMPRWKVGVGPDPTYTNIEAINRQYYSDCLQKHIEKIEIALDYGLEVTTVPGHAYGIELDRDGLFEMDTTGKANAAAQGIASGMSPNEVRKRYWDLGPVKGGEWPYMQNQMWPLKHLAERPMPSEVPPAAPAMPTVTPPEPSEKSFDLDLCMKEFVEMRAA